MSSELPPDVVSSLRQLLQGLSAADNATRQSAEEVLNNDWIATRADMLLSGLAEQVRDGGDANVSGGAARDPFPSAPWGVPMWMGTDLNI